jgi:formylglycine-generating enzyme
MGPETTALATATSQESSSGEMVFIEGGTFRMGSDSHYPEEAPAHRAAVGGFWIDRTPVTNRDFRKFVCETGYVSFAEIAPNPADYLGALPHMLQAGSLVFSPPKDPVDLRNWGAWWTFKFGADWRRPCGTGSSIRDLDDHPVMHITYQDAGAYARWAGKDLPTEAEWEFAARGGLDGTEFAWGNEFMPGGKSMANTWHGQFPQRRIGPFRRTSPVRSFPANGYDLFDMIGNVWEWTSDWYAPTHTKDAEKPCCISKSPRGGSEQESYDPCQPQINPAQGSKGRFSPLRPELLPPLPAGDAPCPAR